MIIIKTGKKYLKRKVNQKKRRKRNYRNKTLFLMMITMKIRILFTLISRS